MVRDDDVSALPEELIRQACDPEPPKVLKRRSAAFLVSPLWMKKADDAAMRKVTRDTVMKAAARLPETIESEQRSDPATMKREFQILPEAITLARSLSLGSDCRQVLSGTMNMLPPKAARKRSAAVLQNVKERSAPLSAVPSGALSPRHTSAASRRNAAVKSADTGTSLTEILPFRRTEDDTEPPATPAATDTIRMHTAAGVSSGPMEKISDGAVWNMMESTDATSQNQEQPRMARKILQSLRPNVSPVKSVRRKFAWTRTDFVPLPLLTRNEAAADTSETAGSTMTAVSLMDSSAAKLPMKSPRRIET